MINLFCLFLYSETVLTQEEHDKEVENPSSPPRPPRPSYLSGNGRESNGFVEDDDEDDTEVIISNHPSYCFDQDSNTTEKDAAPLPASCWYGRISKHKKLEYKLRKKIEEKEIVRLNRQKRFAVGVGVYTYDPRISPLPDKKPPPPRKRKHRIRMYGTVVKQSEYYPQFWLCKF